MIKQVRLVLITATVVALLAVIAVALQLNPVEKEENSGVTIKTAEPVDVQSVMIRNEHGIIDITFSGEGYVVDDIPADLVDMDEFLELMTYCSKVYATQTVASSPQDLAVYGLSEPVSQVEITYSDQSTLTLLMGDVERVTGDMYFRVDGDPAVYLVEMERSSIFLLPKKAFVEDLVTPELALSSPLSALLDVTFTGGQLKDPITVEAVATKNPIVEQAAISFGTATHIVRGKGVYELDQTYAVQMLGPLLGITAYDIVGYGLTPEQITNFGFDKPTMQVEFDLKNGLDADVERYKLSILEIDGTIYMTCNDRGVIYVIPEPAFLELEYNKLLVRWFLSPLLIDVRGISIETLGEEYEFIITGEANADKKVTLNNQEFDIERFRTLLKLLRSAAHDGRLLDDVEVEGEPLLSLKYYYVDAQKQPDLMELFPGDARRVYVRVNGVTELAMQETYLTRVQEALNKLWTDEPIQTEW